MPEPVPASVVAIPQPDGSTVWWELTDGWHLLRTDPAEPMASDAELAIAIAKHAALPNVHHSANAGITGSRTVGGYKLTFTNGLLTGFELA